MLGLEQALNRFYVKNILTSMMEVQKERKMKT
jgi:hypothetical protein